MTDTEDLMKHPLTVKRLYSLLSSRQFEEWYQGAFEDHIGGQEGAKDLNGIILDLYRMTLNR